MVCFKNPLPWLLGTHPPSFSSPLLSRVILFGLVSLLFIIFLGITKFNIWLFEAPKLINCNHLEQPPNFKKCNHLTTQNYSWSISCKENCKNFFRFFFFFFFFSFYKSYIFMYSLIFFVFLVLVFIWICYELKTVVFMLFFR